MTRTARLKDHEGKVHPDLSQQSADTSNGPSRDEYLFSVGQAKRIEDEIAAARLKKKQFRNQLKFRGYNLAMMDVATKEKDREDGTTLQNMRDLKRYLEFEGLPIGSQMSFFDEPQTKGKNASLEQRAFTEGRERGIMGLDPDGQKWPPMTAEGQEHLRGHAEGQDVNKAEFIRLNEALSEAEKAEIKAAAKKGRAALKEETANAAGDAEEGDEGEAESSPPPVKAGKPGKGKPGVH